MVSFLNEAVGSGPATLLKLRIRHSCLPVNFRKFLGAPISQNTAGRLLL